MFKCTECGAVFDEDADIGHVTEEYGQTFDVCPYCGGVFEEAIECDFCGEWLLEEEMKMDEDGNYCCLDCYREEWGEE